MLLSRRQILNKKNWIFKLSRFGSVCSAHEDLESPKNKKRNSWNLDNGELNE